MYNNRFQHYKETIIGITMVVFIVGWAVANIAILTPVLLNIYGQSRFLPDGPAIDEAVVTQAIELVNPH